MYRVAIESIAFELVGILWPDEHFASIDACNTPTINSSSSVSSSSGWSIFCLNFKFLSVLFFCSFVWVFIAAEFIRNECLVHKATRFARTSFFSSQSLVYIMTSTFAIHCDSKDIFSHFLFMLQILTYFPRQYIERKSVNFSVLPCAICK